jgi:hypothetical protein
MNNPRNQNSGLDRKFDLKITLYLRTNGIGKELGLIVYRKTRT